MPARDGICITIIVPAYNQATELSESLGALKAGAGSDAEIIVLAPVAEMGPGIRGQGI